MSGGDAINRVHELRHEHDAILIGGNTAIVDNPILTDRSGKPRRRPLVRVVLDNQLRLSAVSNLISTAGETPTIIFTNSSDAGKLSVLRALGAEVVVSPMGGRDLEGVLGRVEKSGYSKRPRRRRERDRRSILRRKAC